MTIHPHLSTPLMKIIIDRKRFSKRLFFTFVDANNNTIMRSKGYPNLVALMKGINFIKNELHNAYLIYKTDI